MSTAADQLAAPLKPAVTEEVARWLSGFNAQAVSDDAWVWAKHALLDWSGVAIAGASEPLVDMLVDEFTDPDVTGIGSHQCSVVARGVSTSPANAALINGAASHALDYDDVNRRLHGHPTVTVTPVALALGEQLSASGQDVLLSIIAGTEMACLIGEAAGDAHYEAGFHATGTLGTFGATATAASLLKLDHSQTRHALGIAASQIAGLKANFGTMTKPLHAGKAAMNGVLAARLAARGFTANDSVIECPGGAADAMMPGFDAKHTQPHPDGYYAIQQTLFKYHAACYLTHSSIEAVATLRDTHGISLDDLKSMTLKVRPSHFSVCNIPDPQSGLEIKFSIRQCAAMALAGVDTSALETYSDDNALNLHFAQARAKTQVEATDLDDRMAAVVHLELNDGRQFEQAANVGVPASDLDQQWTRLTTKFNALCRPRIGQENTDALAKVISELDQAHNINALSQHLR